MSYGILGSAVQRVLDAVGRGFLTFERDEEGGVRPARPSAFVHIDWCDSTGPYLAPDCSCPCDCGFEGEREVFCSAHEPVEFTTFIDAEGEEWTGSPE